MKKVKKKQKVKIAKRIPVNKKKTVKSKIKTRKILKKTFEKKVIKKKAMVKKRTGTSNVKTLKMIKKVVKKNLVAKKKLVKANNAKIPKKSLDAKITLQTMIKKKIKGLTKLITKGKKKGYLTFEELNNVLPQDIVSPEEIDEILGILEGEKIDVVDSEDEVIKTKEGGKVSKIKATSPIAVNTPAYVEDPVRMYLRQMGKIPLLSREEELTLAKQIEKAELELRKAVLSCPVARYKVLRIANQILDKEVNAEDIIRDEFRLKHSKLMKRVVKLTGRLRTVRRPESILNTLLEFNLTTSVIESIALAIRDNAEKLSSLGQEIARQRIKKIRGQIQK